MKPSRARPATTHTTPETMAIIGQRRPPAADRPRQRQDDRQDHGRERGIRSEDQDAARAEKGIGQERNDRGIESVDPWQPGRLGIRDADRHEHRRQDEAGDDVVSQPGPLVMAKRAQPGNPAHPGGVRLCTRARNPSRRGATG